MKKIQTIFPAIVLLLCAFVACQKPEVVEESDSLKVVKSTLAIPASGGEATIEVEASGTVSVVNNATWLTVNVGSNTIIASADANDDIQSRYSKLALKCGTETVYVTVQQYGWKTANFNPSDINTSAAAAEFVFDYDYDMQMEASSDVSWITVTVTENQLKLAIAENTTEATASDRSRTGNVKWALGVDQGTIAVSQKNLNFMKEDPNWTVSYDGVITYEGESVESITNTVAQSGVSGKYFVSYFTKDDFDASGKEIGDYIDEVVTPEIVTEINAVLEIYAAMGYELSFGDFLYEDTDFNIFDIFATGDYYGVAVGLDDNGEATGHYAYCEFHKAGAPTGYDAWLGEWISSHGKYTDTLVIVQKVKGSTYSVTGLDGVKTCPFEAEYDSANNGLVIRAQENLGTLTLGSYGECSMGVYGSAGTSFYRPTSSNYVILTAQMVDADNASLTPGVVKSSSGEVTLERIKYIGTSSENKYIGVLSNANSTPLPGTITRLGSGGDGGGGDTGGDAYKKWIGSWNVASGDNPFTIVVSENAANSSYYVRGWQFEDNEAYSAMNAYFNADDGSMTLCANTDTPFVTGISLDDPDDPFSLCYVGKIIYTDGNEYYITGSGDMEAARATLNADGSATIKGEKVTLEGDESFDFCRLEVMAFSEKNENTVYTFNGKPSTFPFNMSKASGSSVSQLGGRSVSGASVIRNAYPVCLPAAEECFIMTPVDAVASIADAPVTYRKIIR